MSILAEDCFTFQKENSSNGNSQALSPLSLEANFELLCNSVLDSLAKSRSLVSSFSGQRVCGVVRCFRCRKPRCLYSSKPLTSHNSALLRDLLSTSVFACSSALLPPGHPLEKTIYTKNLDCTMAIETELYHSHFAVQDMCSECGEKIEETAEKCNYKRSNSFPSLPLCKICQPM